MGAFSLLLIAIGAILTFALNVAFEEVDLYAVGIILMAVGGIGLIIAAIRGEFGNFGFSKSRTERHVSEDGQHVVEESHTRT